MKIITYSDIHFEFGADFLPPEDSDADLMILAGDITTTNKLPLLADFLKDWYKPVLYVMGNHEYYNPYCTMDEAEERFRSLLKECQSNAHFLMDEAVSIDGVHFFGGTMWTNFNDSDPAAMRFAQQSMNDFRLVKMHDYRTLEPIDTVKLHERFLEKITAWFEEDLVGPRVVLSHHAPVINPNTQYVDTPLQPAFNSLDMPELISKYQPELWVYGHTHECDDQNIGKTRIISNQFGYPHETAKAGKHEFDPRGCLVKIGQQD